MSNIVNFPSIKPTSRTYTPGRYPQVEFVAQNGAKSVLRYGDKKVDAKLTLGFTNITDSQADEILNLYTIFLDLNIVVNNVFKILLKHCLRNILLLRISFF